MWICNRCGCLIEQAPVYIERMYQGSKPVEIELPKDCDCGGEFEAASECEECGKYYSMYDDACAGDCCPECTAKAKKALGTFMSKYSEALRECMSCLAYDGEY